MTQTAIGKLVDPHVAATATGVSDRHIRRLVHRGDLTNRGKPRKIMVDLDQALDLLGDPHQLR